MSSLATRADFAEFPVRLDAVTEVDDDEGFRAAEVSGDSGPVQSGECDFHTLQDTAGSVQCSPSDLPPHSGLVAYIRLQHLNRREEA